MNPDRQNRAEYFGRWLDLTMENRGIKGGSLAKKLHVHDSAVSRWRNGQALPSLTTCMKLAKILDLDPIRVCITAGIIDGEAVRAQGYPLPEPTFRRTHIKERIFKIPGLTRKERQHLMDAYDDLHKQMGNEA